MHHVLRWRRGVSIDHRSCRYRSSAQQVMLTTLLLLLLLQRLGPCLDQSLFNPSGDFCWKDWSNVDGSWNRVLPGLEHFIQLLPNVMIDQGVSLHEGLVQVVA